MHLKLNPCAMYMRLAAILHVFQSSRVQSKLTLYSDAYLGITEKCIQLVSFYCNICPCAHVLCRCLQEVDAHKERVEEMRLSQLHVPSSPRELAETGPSGRSFVTKHY